MVLLVPGEFTHPTLGAVEIGGFKPYAVTNPEASEIEALGKSRAAFAVYLGSLFPKIVIADLAATPLGGGLYRIKAEVDNVGYLPTPTAHGVTSQSAKPTMVQLGVPLSRSSRATRRRAFFLRAVRS